jgi:glycosyltransferase 2 family protein
LDTEPLEAVAPPEGSASGVVGPAPVETEPPGGRISLVRWLDHVVRVMRSKVFRFGFLAVVLGLFLIVLAHQAVTLWHEVQRLSAAVILLAGALNLCGLFCSLMVWRELLADLGSRLSIPEAWRIMFIGQLAKYAPGSIWPVLAQSELGADRGIPRSRSALSVLLSYAVMTCSGAAVAAVVLPFTEGGSVARYIWVLFLLPVILILLSPPALNRLLVLVLRLSRLPPLDQRISFIGLARTMAWAIAGWSCNGAMVYVLTRQITGDQHGLVLVSMGSYALSWVAGFLAVFAPAGAGVREAVMVAILSSRMTSAAALSVALVSRALAVVSDAVTGAAASALVGRRQLRRLRAPRSASRRSSRG